jgi:hypothetical protein
MLAALREEIHVLRERPPANSNNRYIHNGKFTTNSVESDGSSMNSIQRIMLRTAIYIQAFGCSVWQIGHKFSLKVQRS